MSSCTKGLQEPITSQRPEDLQEPSDGEQSVQSSAYNKLFFPQYVGHKTEYHRD